MILLIIVTFGISAAALAAWLVASPRKAAAFAGGVALVVPYIALLYVGHRVAGITLLDLVLVALGSAALVGLLKSLLRRLTR
jgi:hypothetical protein